MSFCGFSLLIYWIAMYSIAFKVTTEKMVFFFLSLMFFLRFCLIACRQFYILYLYLRGQTCSHGTKCNFIHCFCNPGGDYEWADVDRPPPKYWANKMAALFGYSEEYGYDNRIEQEERNSSKMRTADPDRCAFTFSRRCWIVSFSLGIWKFSSTLSNFLEIFRFQWSLPWAEPIRPKPFTQSS